MVVGFTPGVRCYLILTSADTPARAVARVPGHGLPGSVEGGYCEPACAARVVVAVESMYAKSLP